MEYEESYNHSHSITSGNALTCKETGRVIATFYTEGDLSDVIEIMRQRDIFKVALKKIGETSVGDREIENIFTELV